MKIIALPLAILAFSASGALALEARVTREVAAAPDAVWASVGDFCGIAKWHPAVAKCETLDAGAAQLRRLTLKDGAVLVEKLVQRDDTQRTYSYTIEEGPLPVSDYRSTLKVAPKAGGTVIEWTGTFAAKGKDDGDVVKLITGIYAAGLDGLAKQAFK